MKSIMIKRLAITVLMAASALGCVSLAGCTSATGSAGQAGSTSQSVYDRVMSSGTIRCGYVVGAPGCIKDPNTGKLSGIGIDALELVAKNLGLKVQYTEEVGWGTMTEGLQTNRYDLVASVVWINANRARIADFSRPLYFSPVFAYAKKGDHRFDGKIDLLNSPSYKIATIDGETANVIANEDFPLSKRVSLPQLSDLSQMLLTVSSGKADATFCEKSVATDFLKHNPGAIVPIKGDPVRVFPNCWMFRRGQMEFKDMLDAALDQVQNSGAVEKILRKYEQEQAPGTWYRVAPAYRVPKQ